MLILKNYLTKENIAELNLYILRFGMLGQIILVLLGVFLICLGAPSMSFELALGFCLRNNI
jgi:hypothetical protein